MEGEVILVAIDASAEITDHALDWAARNVARDSDSLILTALVPSHTSSMPTSNIRSRHTHTRTFQLLSCLLKKLGIGSRKASSSSDNILLINGGDRGVYHQVNNICSTMMQKLCAAHDLVQVHTQVKVMADAQLGSVASKAQELQATWVILDRNLKRESGYCLKQLKCNIVLIDHAVPKILKAVNLPMDRNLDARDHRKSETETNMFGLHRRNARQGYTSMTTTRSSVDTTSSIFDTDVSFSLSSPSTSKLIPHKHFLDSDEKVEAKVTANKPHSRSTLQLLLGNKPSSFITRKLNIKLLANPLYDKNNSYEETSKISLPKAKTDLKEFCRTATHKAPVPSRRSADSLRLSENHENSLSSKQLITKGDSLTGNKNEAVLVEPSTSPRMNRTSSVRKAMSLFIKQPPNPPPLCSVCKHNTPIFGKPPRKFSFKELERATDRFSRENFLAEGGFGPVHKGVLSDGQVIAVKQHKLLSAQGASEFCSEVEVLSCAQHRNLVMLVGYCTETEWLLVYEFACNGSLDKHLYGTGTKELMSWKNRMKIAIGAARGLRYLHEDCRVGCIVHRDFRPNNILLTHDFEPMVGDFGLARWQVDGRSAEETRVIGALGYLAPEYILSGLITEKADVYAFGVVLLELLSGFNVTEFSRKTGQQFVSEWGCPLLETMKIDEIIDPLLEKNYVKKEVECMMVVAGFCISPHPDQRPRMSKVLKILEGDLITDMAYDYRQSSSLCSSQNTNLSRSKNLMQFACTQNLSLPLTSAHKVNEESNITKQVTLSVQNEMPSEVDASEEYEVYLRNLLAKFVQNLNK